MSVPQSVINICSGVSLNPSYEHTIYFNTPAEQTSFFAGKVVKTFSAYTFLRKTWDIKVEATMEQAFTWSYLFFKNYSSKTYYYFITNVEYISDTTVKLTLELDVMQTYMFNYELLPCFVEREHADSDVIGSNTVEESVDVGEYTSRHLFDSHEGDAYEGKCCVMILASIDPFLTTYEETVRWKPVAGINGLYNGLSLFAVHPDNFNRLSAALLRLDTIGKSDGILSMWMYPLAHVGVYKEADESVGWDIEGSVGQPVIVLSATAVGMSPPNAVSEYVPVNNKVMTYPYNLIYVTNNSGEGATFRYERFADRTACVFQILPCFDPDGSMKCVPVNYNGNEGKDFEEGITLKGFPSCAWNQDVYKLWLAQNFNSMQHSFGMAQINAGIGAGGSIISMLSGNIAGGAGGLISTATNAYDQIGGMLAQQKDRAIQPPQSKGTYSPSLNFTHGKQQFSFYIKQVDNHHAKAIDEYFSLYGYAVKRVKVPNINSRAHWNFVRTVGCKIKTNICTEDAVKIEAIYNKGVTFWHNGNNIGNYHVGGDKMENPIK